MAKNRGKQAEFLHNVLSGAKSSPETKKCSSPQENLKTLIGQLSVENNSKKLDMSQVIVFKSQMQQ